MRFVLIAACTAFTSVSAFTQHDHSAMHGGGHEMEMPGMYGSYAMTRESSGTSWQPEATPMMGFHHEMGEWMVMVHGLANAVYDRQTGPRGGEDFFGSSMFMVMGQRHAGPGTFGLRAMLSLDPATMRQSGYPLLLQSGETADGRTPLIDRQHPHDLFMELAATYSLLLGKESSAFAYFGLPGEPALGPSAFMHRFSGMDNPNAPITHHWLDSTHITYGVATLGYTWQNLKIDGSIFHGREPNEFRWDIEEPRFDSYSLRLTYNPTLHWSMQASYGWLNSPEELDPEINTERLTASVTYHAKIHTAQSQTTLAWGQNRHHPGKNLDGFLLETALQCFQGHTILARAETVAKDDLFRVGNPLQGRTFQVSEFSLGYIYDFVRHAPITAGLGVVGTYNVLPREARNVYGQVPMGLTVFLRIKH